MNMVETRHRASKALQKPSMHETAGYESRLWIFDQVSSGAAERKQETNAPSRSGTTANWAFCKLCGLLIGDFVGSKPQHGTAWAYHGRRHGGGLGGCLWVEGEARGCPGYKPSSLRT